jgi:hypothetical protein
MIIKVRVDDATYARMMVGKRVEGTIGFDPGTGVKDFRAFNRKSREAGYERPADELLYTSSSGWLKASARRFKVFVSVNRSMGRERSASELLMQSKELTDHLRHMKTIEEILEEI